MPEEITYDEFAKAALKAATIVSAERIEGADKLYRLTVDAGEGQMRTLVAGIAKHYSPEELAGRQIIIVANLAPRAVRGVLSQGMLLAADCPDGKAALLAPDKKVQNGTLIR